MNHDSYMFMVLKICMHLYELRKNIQIEAYPCIVREWCIVIAAGYFLSLPVCSGGLLIPAADACTGTA